MNINPEIAIWLFFFSCFLLICWSCYSRWSDKRWLYIMIVVANILLGVYGAYVFATYPSNDVLCWSVGLLFFSGIILVIHFWNEKLETVTNSSCFLNGRAMAIRPNTEPDISLTYPAHCRQYCVRLTEALWQNHIFTPIQGRRRKTNKNNK